MRNPYLGMVSSMCVYKRHVVFVSASWTQRAHPLDISDQESSLLWLTSLQTPRAFEDHTNTYTHRKRKREPWQQSP